MTSRPIGSDSPSDDFHKAPQELIPEYAAAREGDPTGRGLNHEGCDHAYGICTADWGDYD